MSDLQTLFKHKYSMWHPTIPKVTFPNQAIRKPITLEPEPTDHSVTCRRGKNSTNIMQSLPFIVFIVCEKIATLKFLPHTDNRRPAGLTLITDSHFSCESTTKKKKPIKPWGHYSPGLACARFLGLGEEPKSAVSRRYRCKRVICLLYFQTKALCSRQQMTRMTPSRAQSYSGTKPSTARSAPGTAKCKRTIQS